MKPNRLIAVVVFMLLCSLMLFGTVTSHAQATPQPMPTLQDLRDQTGIFQTSDTRGLSVSIVGAHTDGSTVVKQFGASDTFTMTLAAQPAAPIKLSRQSFPFAFVILPKEVTFTPENWNVPQTLTVYATQSYNPENRADFVQTSHVYIVESWDNGVYDSGHASLNLSITFQHTPMPIPTDPLVVTTLADSLGTEISGSFRQMINIANSRVGADTITFQSGLSGTITLVGDLQRAAADLTVIGSGEDQIIIDGVGLYSAFYDSYAAAVTLEALTLTNLRSAVWAANVTLTDVTVTNSGEGISMAIGYPPVVGFDNVTLNRVTMMGNSGVYGGALIGKNIHITDSTFINNEAVSVPLASGVLAAGGGAIYVGGTGTIERSTFTNNTAVNGGAIYVTESGFGDYPLIRDNTFSMNSADNGGAIYASNSGRANVLNNTFSMNSADNGGAIYALKTGGNVGFIRIFNSTFSANTASDAGAAVMGFADVVYSTFSGHNTSVSEGIALLEGGGTLIGSVIANNNAVDPYECGTSVYGFGLLANDLNCYGNLGVPTRVDPVLRDNGGTTQTHALLAGSNAINFDPDIEGEVITTCEYLARTFTDLNEPFTDQRGISRPQWGICDFGAFEADGLSTPYENLLTNGGFETVGLTTKKAANWTVKNPETNDRRICDTLSKPIMTVEGECVFQFNSVATPGLARSLKQTVSTGDLGGAGETMTLSAFVSGNKFKTGAKIILTVTYTDNTTAKKAILIPKGTYAFTEISGALNLTKTVKTIVVNINVLKLTGRIRLDDLWLSVSDTAPLAFPSMDAREGATPDSPTVPDGFRDGN